jgi:zinc protease
MSVNRSIAPPIKPIRNIKYPDLNYYTLDNGIKVTEINKTDQEIVQIELMNSAGRIQEDKMMASRVTATLLKDGAGGKSGQEIAEKVDYYGGSISSGSNLDISRAGLFTLTQYQDKVIPYLADIWLQPNFTETELLKHKKNKIQKLQEELSKPDTVSYRSITEELFGIQHPYGYNSNQQLYDQLSIDDVNQHFSQHFGHNNMEMVLTGKVSAHTRKLINQHFGQFQKTITPKTYTGPQLDLQPESKFMSIGSPYQTSIKIGRRLFTRDHPDYAAMFVLNVVLGGYFGSRLMSSIREDKGYTYNIYSSLGTFRHDGFFYIATDVDHELVHRTKDEIYHQIDRLQQDLISEKEMEMVRNYILGHFLSMLDGPFNIAQLVKTFIIHGLDPDHFNNMKDTVENIQPDQLRTLAQQYLDRNQMIEVIVGN